VNAATVNNYEDLTAHAGAGISHRPHLIAQEAKVTPLMSKDLAECAGKEGLMITVVYPPGASRSRLARLFTKVPTTFIPLAGTQATRNRPNSLCF
jgi:hypothetical protein